jgi:uncharacterized surface protein with fasciclin (FAS1) repeats
MKTYLAMALAASSVFALACDDETSSKSSMNGNEATGGKGDEPKAGSGAAGMGTGTGGKDAPAMPDEMDIIETALAAGDFKQLAGALTTADLVDTLQGKGPFTVFAPNDAAFDAFEKANPGVLAKLTKEELTGILTYHVISGAAVMSKDLKEGQLAATVAGPSVAISLKDGATINAAKVIKADIETSNGVIHVIDSIMLPPGDIIAVATAAGSFKTLAGALTTAGLVETLQGKGPFTVFAPTDAAFAAFEKTNPGVIGKLSKEELAGILTYHVVSGTVGPLDLKDGGIATTVAGSPVLFDLSKDAMVNDAMITTANVVAKNGVIHVIDAVILPPTDDIVATAIAAGSFTSLAGALTSAGLVETLQGKGPFTVFAPTDDAFAKLAAVPTGDALKNVLLYHVVDGAVGAGNLVDGAVPSLLKDKMLTVDLKDGVKINKSNVTTANILCSNGVIHIVDSVLVPE